jgi:N-acyl-D-aspartate/D-glutamate deacylase
VLDLLLKGARVFDGSGGPSRVADIGIAAGRIARVAPRIESPAREVRDVSGLWALPGFVDIHTHYDVEVEITPGLPESVRHGVTAVVMGNCSLSLTMGRPQDLGDIFLRVENLPSVLVRKWLAASTEWDTPRDYLAHLRTLPLGPHVAPLLGHSALRTAVMGLERSLGERATDDEIARMRVLALEALDAGCFGISVDRVHWHKVSGAFAGRSLPSHYADARELRMLADVCRERDAVFQVTPNTAIGSVLRVLALGIGVFRPPLRLTVLSALDMTDAPQLWRVYGLAAFVMNRLLGSNLRFQTLPEPLAVYADGPVTPLFEEFASGVELNTCDAAARRSLWRSAGFRERFRRDWERGGLHAFHRDAARMTIVSSPDPSHAGRTFADVGRDMGLDPCAAVMELLERHDEDLRWVACGANERAWVRERLASHPHILPGFSDAGAHARNLAYFDSALALLRQAIATGFMSPERAIARVTGEAARWFNVDAGELREGRRADVVLLHPEALRQPAPGPIEVADAAFDGARRMVKRAPGCVAAVFVRGIELVRDGEPLAALGRVAAGTLLAPTATARGREAVLARYRNRLSDDQFDHPFRSYWDIFVFKHQARGNVMLHCAGVVMMYAAIGGALATLNPWWLLLAPLSQATGLAGHVVFERNHVDTRDVVFSWRASRCLNRMFVSVVRGLYWSEVRRVNDEFATFRAATA